MSFSRVPPSDGFLLQVYPFALLAMPLSVLPLIELTKPTIKLCMSINVLLKRASPHIPLAQEGPILHPYLQQRCSLQQVEELLKDYTEAQLPTLNFMELIMAIAKATILCFMVAN